MKRITNELLELRMEPHELKYVTKLRTSLLLFLWLTVNWQQQRLLTKILVTV